MRLIHKWTAGGRGLTRRVVPSVRREEERVQSGRDIGKRNAGDEVRHVESGRIGGCARGAARAGRCGDGREGDVVASGGRREM